MCPHFHATHPPTLWPQVDWSEGCGEECELLVQGQPRAGGDGSPLGFINHERYWGACNRAALGKSCNCKM